MMRNFGFIWSVVVATAVMAVPFDNGVQNNEINEDFVSGLNNCAYQSDSDGILTCATERIVRSIDVLSSQSNIDILPGVSLIGESTSFRSGKSLKEEIEKAKSGEASMFELIGNATARFISGRTLKVKLPTSEEIGRALEEGRKRMGGNKNKNGGMHMGLMGGLGAVFAGLVPIFLGKIALITAKALFVGKIALVLSAILLFQMFSRGGNKHQTVETSWSSAPQVSYGPPSNSYGPPAASYGVPSAQYPYSRSLTVNEEEPKYSQELAYSAQRK
ncbi:uncharacterized protein LOC126742124 [Anthonomus grandis grandis]|uniref:uncharacterized protein LOC126742124 n=1 Tax=Anthonomus grandis grandis TaxID=2921223 RepID=UPI002165DCE1|nr:uncharacterized protein LOC126742124 [Anthonomus grandis grandis]